MQFKLQFGWIIQTTIGWELRVDAVNITGAEAVSTMNNETRCAKSGKKQWLQTLTSRPIKFWRPRKAGREL
jgi:hypothetical protein